MIFQIGIPSLAVTWMLLKDKDEKNRMGFRSLISECAKFSDKHIDGAVAKIDDGVKDLSTKYPSIKKPKLNYGLRGTRYFIEFPITGKNVDAFSLLIATQAVINDGRN